jgi:hypothetical protein
MYCSSCEQKFIQIQIEKTDTIWDFNPYIFNTYQSLKKGFKDFYKSSLINDNFYSIHNEDGYTYTQWYVYIISKNNYKYKELKKSTLWLFQVLCNYDFFKKLIFLGKKEDSLHNTLHHFLKYLDNIGLYQECILNILLNNNLNLDQEDGEGISGNEYLSRKSLSEDDLKLTKELTKTYKNNEDDLFSHYIFNDSSFSKCISCNKFIDIYKDIILNKDKITGFKEILEKFDYIIKKRQDCINIYKKYKNCENSMQRHEYVVNIYKQIFI